MSTKCLFPVAGYGTRFLPATKAMPKEILPIVSKPLVQYGVEEAVEAGLTDCCFVTGRGKRALEDHFDISYELEQEIAGAGKESRMQANRKCQRCLESDSLDSIILLSRSTLDIPLPYLSTPSGARKEIYVIDLQAPTHLQAL